MSAVKKGLVAGAFSLALAGLISKFLGVIYNVPFQNIAGDTAMAYYNAAYSYYATILQISTAGIPLAISKMISERNAVRDYAGADQIYRVGARYLTLAGLFFFLLMFAGGGVIARLSNLDESVTSMRALSFALLIVPVMAAMRGYLQGHQSMAESGNSQVIEQFIRVIFSLAAVYIAVKWMESGARWSAAVATFGAVLGAVGSLLYLGKKVVAVRRENRKKYLRQTGEPNKVVFKRLLVVSIPITLSSLVLPLSQLIDTNTIVNLLIHGMHMSKAAAQAEYGILTGRALRLVALPLSLATAVGLSLMPAITQASAERNRKKMADNMLMALRLTSFFSFPIAFGICVLAGPLNLGLFENGNGTSTIATVGFMAIFSSYEMVTTYMLQALGYMYLPIRSMFAGLGFKLLLNLFLVPHFGIFGAAISSVLGYLLSSLLNFRAVRKLSGVPLPFLELFGKPLLSSVVMGLFVWVVTLIPADLFFPWSERLANLLQVAIGTAAGGVVFLGLMIVTKGVTKDELARMPILKRFVR